MPMSGFVKGITYLSLAVMIDSSTSRNFQLSRLVLMLALMNRDDCGQARGVVAQGAVFSQAILAVEGGATCHMIPK
jgi:hypothetical protein